MKGKDIADLVDESIESSISIEIGSVRKGDDPDLLRKTMRETSSKFGILISDVERPEIADKVLKLPSKKFLCL